jgi:hypothetical protein
LPLPLPLPLLWPKLPPLPAEDDAAADADADAGGVIAVVVSLTFDPPIRDASDLGNRNSMHVVHDLDTSCMSSVATRQRMVWHGTGGIADRAQSVCDGKHTHDTAAQHPTMANIQANNK